MKRWKKRGVKGGEEGGEERWRRAAQVHREELLTLGWLLYG